MDREDCPWCGEPLLPAEGSDGQCRNGHEVWEEDVDDDGDCAHEPRAEVEDHG